MRAQEQSPISLAGREMVAEGRRKVIYRHPDDPELLIKVIRTGFRTRSLIPSRYGKFESHVRDCEEFIANCAAGRRPFPFSQKVDGFAETDLGLGLVVRAILGENGELAPNLFSLVHHKGIGESLRDEIRMFLRELIDSDIVINNLDPANIVRGVSQGGVTRLILTGGHGLSLAAPLKHFSAFNRASKSMSAFFFWRRLERAVKH